jgi:hypothetical protein
MMSRKTNRLRVRCLGLEMRAQSYSRAIANLSFLNKCHVIYTAWFAALGSGSRMFLHVSPNQCGLDWVVPIRDKDFRWGCELKREIVDQLNMRSAVELGQKLAFEARNELSKHRFAI